MTAYYTGIITLVIFSMVIISLIAAGNDLLDLNKKKEFITLFSIVIIVSLAEWLGVYLDYKPMYTRTFHIAVKVVEFSFAVTLPILCLRIIDYLDNAAFPLGMIILHSILEIISGFTGFIFYVDDENVYQHGEYYWIYMIFYIVGILLFIYGSFQVSKRYHSRNKIVIFLIMIFLLTGISMQTTDSSIRVDWLCAAIDIILMYSYYCQLVQQTDSLTGLLNRRCYDSRIERLKEKITISIYLSGRTYF